jgi:hypothetical protein
MQVIGVLNKKFIKASVIHATVGGQKSRSHRRLIARAFSLFIWQALAWTSMVGAQPRISWIRSTVDMKRKNVSGDWTTTFITRIGINTVDSWCIATFAQALEILHHHIARALTGGTQRQST